MGRRTKGRSTTITQKQIDKMRQYAEEGKTLECIADIMGLDICTIQKKTRGVVRPRKYNRVKNDEILEELKSGKLIVDIARELGVSISRIEKTYRENKKEIEIKEFKEDPEYIERRENVMKICKEVERQKLKMQKEHEAALEEEKKTLAKRWSFMS